MPSDPIIAYCLLILIFFAKKGVDWSQAGPGHQGDADGGGVTAVVKAHLSLSLLGGLAGDPGLVPAPVTSCI